MNDVPPELLVHVFEYLTQPVRAVESFVTTHYPRLFYPPVDAFKHYKVIYQTIIPVCKKWYDACLNEGRTALFNHLKLEGNDQFTDSILSSISENILISKNLKQVTLEQTVVDNLNQNIDTRMSQNGVMKFFEYLIRQNNQLENLSFKLLLLHKKQALFDMGILCASLSRFSSLQTIEFLSLFITDDIFIEMISEMPHLREIIVWGCELLGDRSLLYITNQPSLQQNLVSLRVGGFNIHLTDRSISELEKLTNLQYLSISRCHRVVDLSKLPTTLLTLDLSFCQNLTTVEHLTRLTKLRSLNLRRAGTELKESLPSLSNLTSLQCLNLRELSIDSDTCTALLHQLTNLQYLDLYDNNEIKSSFAFITQYHTNIQYLNLYEIHMLDNVSMKHIFETCKVLHTLIVTIPRVTDQLFIDLIVQKNTCLRVLDINNAIHMTNVGFIALCETFPKLNHLAFARCNSTVITQQALQGLRYLPELQVLDLTSFPFDESINAELLVGYLGYLVNLKSLSIRNCKYLLGKLQNKFDMVLYENWDAFVRDEVRKMLPQIENVTY
jgi:hypothetical protein